MFIDDNPAEREIIRQQLPGVTVPELTAPEDYIKAIDSKEPYFRINWDNSIDWQLSRFVKCAFKTWLISDPNVTITKEDGSVAKRGVQFKEFLSFNFTYTFATK